MRILIVEDTEEIAEAYRSIVESTACEIQMADGVRSALKLIDANVFDVVVTDLKLAERAEGLEVLKAAKTKDPDTQVIVVSYAFSTPELSDEAMRLGAFDFMQKNTPAIDFFKMLPYKIDLAYRFRQALRSRAVKTGQ